MFKNRVNTYETLLDVYSRLDYFLLLVINPCNIKI